MAFDPFKNFRPFSRKPKDKPLTDDWGTKMPGDGGGLRFDDGKNQLELVPPLWIWALADVLTCGARKYAARNWERGMAWGKMIGCALRHIFKFCCGERYDEETGCHHLAMAAWNLLALMTYDLKGIGTNDLNDDTMELLSTVNSGKGTNYVPD